MRQAGKLIFILQLSINLMSEQTEILNDEVVRGMKEFDENFNPVVDQVYPLLNKAGGVQRRIYYGYSISSSATIPHVN